MLGPPIRKEQFTSGDFVKKMLLGVTSTVPSERKPVCDVRDVARAHLLAIKNPIAANRRFIVCSGSFNYCEFARQQKELGWPVTDDIEAERPEGTIFN